MRKQLRMLNINLAVIALGCFVVLHPLQRQSKASIAACTAYDANAALAAKVLGRYSLVG
jgi:hypothetical protein